ncbi:MAG: efflux RND transporter permease subunit [Chloroflexi bacterium]|nr:efflux RND transporter permease subunit [Chloroflexota bacterium]
MGLTRIAIVRPLAMLMLIVGMVFMGAVAYTRLPVSQLPPISRPFVNVIVGLPNASAQDVEAQITKPVERVVAGTPGVQQMSATSSQGRSVVTLQLYSGISPSRTIVYVDQELAHLRLPVNALSPLINTANPNARPVLNIALTGPEPLDQLYSLATETLQPQLQALPGVANVAVTGGLQQQIQVLVNTAKLTAYGISISQVSQALASANISTPAGAITQGAQVIDVRTVGQFQTVSDVANALITSTTAGPVYVRDVAKVTEGDVAPTQAQFFNGKPAVGLVVLRQSDANTLAVASAVHTAVAKLQTSLPKGAKLIITNDTSTYIRSALDAIQTDIGIAIILVAVVMLAFLHEWRNTVIVVLAIPTSIISTFLVMYFLHFSLNLMTLMALALVIGILVDDSIVVLENITRHLHLGESPRDAAIKGRSEIGLAALAITASDIVVYIPIAFMTGIVGELFLQYGLTVVATTALSLFMSFTLTPMLASRWLRHQNSRGLLARFGERWDAGFGALARGYGRLVQHALHARLLVIGVALATVLASFSVFPLHLIGAEFTPQEDNNQFNVGLHAAPGTSLATMTAAAQKMEAVLRHMPGVTGYFTTVNVAASSGAVADVAVQLLPKSQRPPLATLLKEARLAGNHIPGVRAQTTVYNPLILGGIGNAIPIVLSGPNLTTLESLAPSVEQTAQGVPGVASVLNLTPVSTPQINLVLNPAAMAQLGVTAQEVSVAASAAIGGNQATMFQPATGYPQPIRVISHTGTTINLQQIGLIPVAPATAMRGPVMLGQVATVTQATGPVAIHSINREPTLTLRAIISGQPLGTVAGELQSTFATLQLPPGYTIQLVGQVQQFNAAIATMVGALSMALILQYMLLVALYESWLLPLVRFSALPLGLIGALLALLITHNTLNIFSAIGMIMAEGLVTKNGILLVDYTNTLRERGYERTAALIEAGRTRLRPILMTTATMVFGMLPLAFKLEAGAESRAPMAVVVIGSLLSSTLLTLFVVPVLYTLLDDLRQAVSSRWAQRTRSRAQPSEGAAISDGHAGSLRRAHSSDPAASRQTGDPPA